MPENTVENFIRSPFVVWRRYFWQSAAISAALGRNFDAYIFLGNPNFLSTWLAAGIARLRGRHVLFWTHGWLRAESGIRARLRGIFYRLANTLLVYSDRARHLGIESGFPADRIVSVYNSLDLAQADRVLAAIAGGELTAVNPASYFDNAHRPIVICTARITKLCEFDVLFGAAKILAIRGQPINIFLVGDGPERESLALLASELAISAYFYGPCYDEEILGQLIYRSDLTVSPGKIGLTAIHSLMYGTPAATHDELDLQMPEVEALTEGVTGTFFEHRDPAALADALGKWFGTSRDRAQIRKACRDEVRARWSPTVQVSIIEKALAQSRGTTDAYA
jgi:glycosyltransferase involved in cell wall biosynthesis